MRRHLEKFKPYIRFGFVCLFILSPIACQKASRTLPGSEDSTGNNPFTDQFRDDFGNSGDLFGSGPSGDNADLGGVSGVSPLEREALGNAFDEAETVNPQNEPQIDPDIEADLRNLIAKEGQGQDTSAQRILTSGAALRSCLSKVRLYEPAPGAALQGTWTGKCPFGKVSFSVRGIPEFNFTRAVTSIRDTVNRGFPRGLSLGGMRFAVTGNHKIRGNLRVNSDGVGRLSAGDWTGVLSDINGTGQIFKSAQPACKATVKLSPSGNDTPTRLAEGTKVFADCVKKYAIVSSSVMDRLFKSLPKEVSTLLRTRMLGLK